MALLEILALNEASNQIQVPDGSPDNYGLPANLNALGHDITAVGTLIATNIIGSLAFTSVVAGLTSTNVEDAINESAADVLAFGAGLYVHGIGAAAHAAANITFDPGLTAIVGTTVQSVILELNANTLALEAVVDALSVGSGIGEAPNDGLLYARKQLSGVGSWEEIAASGIPVFTSDTANPGLVPASGSPTGRVLTDSGWDEVPVSYTVFDATHAGLAPDTTVVGATLTSGTRVLCIDGTWRAIP